MLCPLFEQRKRYNVVIYYLLLLLTDRPIVAPTLDDIIGKDRDYSKAIPKQNNYEYIGATGQIFWLDKQLQSA